MKRRIILSLAATIFLAACNNNKPAEKKEVTINPVQNAAQDIEKQKTELEKLTALTPDQLKAMIPESLMGAKRTSIEANSSMGASLAHGEYELNDSTRIALNIYDCGGPAGAGIYSMQYLGLFNLQQENDEEYTKTIDFNGGKAFEQCEKATNDCTLSYFSGGRFMVTLEADRIGIEALKQAARGLNIK
ncbi:MAG TPA: hypothetical protein VIV35_03210 [Chitinophagaceae bacterium]